MNILYMYWYIHVHVITCIIIKCQEYSVFIFVATCNCTFKIGKIIIFGISEGDKRTGTSFKIVYCIPISTGWGKYTCTCTCMLLVQSIICTCKYICYWQRSSIHVIIFCMYHYIWMYMYMYSMQYFNTHLDSVIQ